MTAMPNIPNMAAYPAVSKLMLGIASPVKKIVPTLNTTTPIQLTIVLGANGIA